MPMGRPLEVLKKSPLMPATTRYPWSSSARAAAVTVVREVSVPPKVAMGVTSSLGE